MKRIFTTLFLSFFIHGLYAQDSLNITKLATWTYDSANAYNDIWGYTDANGKEYAIVGSSWGTHFIDITTPTNPIEIASFIGKSSNVIWRDYKTAGTYCYGVADGAANSLQIFDLSNLPNSVTKVYDDNSLTTSAHNIFIEGDRIYLPSNSRGGTMHALDILSISNPTTPVLIGTMDANTHFGGCWGCLHDIYVRNDTAYCSAGNVGFYIYDVSDPVNPQFITSILSYSEQGYNHASWVNEDRDVLIMADETHGSGLKSFDISDVALANEINVFRSNVGAIPHNPFIVGTECIVSYYHDGMQIFDISDPHNIVQKAYYDTYPDNAPGSYGGYEGDWGVYPFFKSRVIVANDIKYGLNILGKINDVYTSNVCMTDSVRFNYNLKGNFNTGNKVYVELSDANGKFYTPNIIDSISATTNGNYTMPIPSGVTVGSKYRIRLKTSNPAVIQGDYALLDCSVNGIGKVQKQFINIYPNPSTGLVTINNKIDRSTYSIQVIDSKGSISYEELNCVGSKQLQLDKGIYAVRIVSNNQSITEKIIVY